MCSDNNALQECHNMQVCFVDSVAHVSIILLIIYLMNFSI
jgi:hypothetical protein